MKDRISEGFGHYLRVESLSSQLKQDKGNSKLREELFLSIHCLKGIFLGYGEVQICEMIHCVETNHFGKQIDVAELLAQVDKILLKLKQGKVFLKLELSDYFHLLVKNISEFANKKISFVFEINQGLFQSEEILMREILTPLIINSIDHGTSIVGGAIELRLRVTETEVFCCLKDDGIKNNTKDTQQLSLLSGRGLGLKFVKWQVSELGDGLKIEKIAGKGVETSFTIYREIKKIGAA